MNNVWRAVLGGAAITALIGLVAVALPARHFAGGGGGGGDCDGYEGCGSNTQVNMGGSPDVVVITAPAITVDDPYMFWWNFYNPYAQAVPDPTPIQAPTIPKFQFEVCDIKNESGMDGQPNGSHYTYVSYIGDGWSFNVWNNGNVFATYIPPGGGPVVTGSVTNFPVSIPPSLLQDALRRADNCGPLIA